MYKSRAFGIQGMERLHLPEEIRKDFTEGIVFVLDTRGWEEFGCS